MDALEQALKKAYIDRNEIGSYYDPKLIINQPTKKQFLLNVLQEDINTSEGFIFSIAFLTQDGLNAIKTQLADLNRRGISGRLITSTYLQFNHPDVFDSLMNIPNLEVRLSDKKGFHAKGYVFKHKDYQSFIIGSSNLTMSALKLNYEWNLRLTTYNHGEIIHQMINHLEEEWNRASPLTKEWIRTYRLNYIPPSEKDTRDLIQDPTIQPEFIAPNKMQTAALNSLEEMRNSGARRSLVISATGTGKTYLAAFDVLNVQPNKMLFIVHREQILKDALRSFKRIIGGPDSDYGILSGNSKEITAKYLFATIQTISKPKYHGLFDQDYFDYILIDEVHKAGADSYLKTIDYFEPDFLLGMTATPERTDDINIYELFDYNIAYEIRLQEALEEDLLAPFHYFGVTDYEKDGEVISETTDLNYLTTYDRADFLIKKLNYYGASHNEVRGLVFCSRKAEAKELAGLFNKSGIPSTYLSGDHSIERREQAVQNLEKGKIKYIFTVDIFNEGIDIPMINQIVMLRNTDSSIIFIQQLGRGLRKHKTKEFVTVIDFIGNYKNNYMIPMALSGDITHNKNNLRKDTYDTTYIHGLSSINFEEIAKERIFKSIDSVKLDSMKELKDKYNYTKERLDHVPKLMDFQKHHVLDPYIIANKKDSFYDFLVYMKDNQGTISKAENIFLKFLSREILPGIRLHEIVLLHHLIDHRDNLTQAEIHQIFINAKLPSNKEIISSVIATLSITFYTGGFKKTYAGAEFIKVHHDDSIEISDHFNKALKNNYFKAHLLDLLETAEDKSKMFNPKAPLTRYKKYRRRDAIRLLGWGKQMVDQNIGGYTYADGKFVIFVTLEKGDDFKGALVAYEDKLLDPSNMIWFTKSPRTLASPEIDHLKNSDNWKYYMFVKKSDDEGNDFYYLGQVTPDVDTITQVEKETSEGHKKSVVEMNLKFTEPIEQSLFNYLK